MFATDQNIRTTISDLLYTRLTFQERTHDVFSLLRNAVFAVNLPSAASVGVLAERYPSLGNVLEAKEDAAYLQTLIDAAFGSESRYSFVLR